MFDIALLFIMALAGGIVAVIGFIIILGQRISKPKRELQQKIDKLEEEIQELKSQK